MGLISWLFGTKKVQCPRCLGKGQVDTADIQRLKKEIYWSPGKCAYCEGSGKVPPERLSMVPVDNEYLTIDLPYQEWKKLVTGDEEALKRGEEQKIFIDEVAATIEHLYYIENQEPPQIAEYLYLKYRIPRDDAAHHAELVAYIEKVIMSKRTRI